MPAKPTIPQSCCHGEAQALGAGEERELKAADPGRHDRSSTGPPALRRCGPQPSSASRRCLCKAIQNRNLKQSHENGVWAKLLQPKAPQAVGGGRSASQPPIRSAPDKLTSSATMRTGRLEYMKMMCIHKESIMPHYACIHLKHASGSSCRSLSADTATFGTSGLSKTNFID